MDVSTQYFGHGMAGVTTLGLVAYCIACKEVGLAWKLENIAPAKDLAEATFLSNHKVLRL